jgi:uncharacterized membrane protein
MGLKVNFSGGVPAWLALSIALVAVAVTLLSYLRARRGARGGHVTMLALLRVFAVVILLILALRPLVTAKFERGRQGELAVLLDTSGSMAIRDYPNLPDRLTNAKAALAADSPQMRTLKERFKVSVFAFDDGLKGETPLSNVPALQPAGASTKLSGALNAIAAKFTAGTPSRILLLSDGVDTQEGVTKYEGPVPVTAVAVGSKLSAEGAFRDIILSKVEVLPEGQPVVSKDNVAQIAAYVEGLGYAGFVVPVRLEDAEGKVLAQENLAIDSVRGDQKLVLSYTPIQKGNFKLSVKIPVQPDETIKENNARSLNITVTDARINVLYVEGTLRWEYRYVKRILERDPNVRLAALVRLSQRTFYQQGNVTDIQMSGVPQDLETLRKFNVIIIGDVPASAFSAADMANIRELVSSGAGFAMLGGYNSFADGGYAATPIADVLPVDLADGAGGQDKNEFVPALTGEGEVNPIFAGITDYFGGPSRKPARDLPPLLGQSKIGRPKPAAAVLAVNPLRSDAAGSLPVIVVHNFGSGRAVAFAGDTTWRWYAPLVGLGMESPFVKFWGQLVRFLARREVEKESGRPGVTAFLDKAFYAPGDKVAITAEVRGSDGLLTDKAAVDAAVDGPAGFSTPLAAVAGSRGTYSAVIDAPAPGNYRVNVNAVQGAAPIGQAALGFDVEAEDVEMRRIDLDEDNLRRIASASGGLYVPLVEFASYVAGLEARGETEVTVEVLNLRRKGVLYPLFLIFIALATAEWVWRKRLEMP